MADLSPGAAFALLDDTLASIPQQAGFVPVVPGGMLTLTGSGGDDVQIVPIRTTGRAQRPLSPVHVTGQWRADGGLLLRWVPRSRGGFAWMDGLEAPLDEAVEQYRVDVQLAGDVQSFACTTPELVLDAAQIVQWRAVTPQLSLAVCQMGPQVASIPSSLIIPL